MRARDFLVLISATIASGAAIADQPQLVIKSAAPHQLVSTNRSRTLYTQMGSTGGTGINSQNYETEFDAYDDEAADDFIVPEGAIWKVMEVDMLGYGQEGPADSMNVVFYKDKHGAPGKIAAQFTDIPPGDNDSGPLDLGRGVKLKAGHYWLSIQANLVFNEGGQWSWGAQDDAVNLPAMWRNPGDGFGTGCIEWTVETICLPFGQGDQMFALKGKAR